MCLPPPMLWKGNISENWKKFVQRFDLYMEATEKTKKSDKTYSAAHHGGRSY